MKITTQDNHTIKGNIILTLSGKFNSEVMFSDEEGIVLDMFIIFLVNGSIVNSFSISCLEYDRYCVTYDLFVTLFVYFF